MTQIPVADGLFTWPSDEPALLASEVGRSAVLPASAREAGRIRSSGSGTLWTFTSQNFRPPAPPYDGNDTAETFQPYLVGYVELEGELLVEGRLVDCAVEDLEIGQPMELRIVPYTVRPDGTEVLTYAFAPVRDANSEEAAR